MVRIYFSIHRFMKTAFLPGFVVWLGACTALQGRSYDDTTTYKNLTDLKPEIAFLYASFIQDPVDHEWIFSIRLKLAQIYEYERGKGAEGEVARKHVGEIQKLFEKHLDERQGKGPWSEKQIESRTQSISGAFDAAIKAERLKNKGED